MPRISLEAGRRAQAATTSRCLPRLLALPYLLAHPSYSRRKARPLFPRPLAPRNPRHLGQLHHSPDRVTLGLCSHGVMLHWQLDVSGFTAMSSNIGSEELVGLINALFTSIEYAAECIGNVWMVELIGEGFDCHGES
eukprot:570984-Rhodomonas_salina.4